MKSLRYFALFMMLLMVTAASADSLWTSSSRSMMSDPKAQKIGDVVTILVQESSATAQKASTGYAKSLDHSNKAGVGPLMKYLPAVTASSEQSGSASGSTSKTMSFTASITAKVTEVLPNGNLKLEGSRSVQTNDEKQTIKVTGIVRPEDITPENTVYSTYLSDAEIKCDGKGPIGDRQREGLISKLIKYLF